jgi:hypothetical protein
MCGVEANTNKFLKPELPAALLDTITENVNVVSAL